MNKSEIVERIKMYAIRLEHPINFAMDRCNATGKYKESKYVLLPDNWELLSIKEWLLPTLQWFQKIHNHELLDFRQMWRYRTPIHWQKVLELHHCDDTRDVIMLANVSKRLKQAIRRRKDKPKFFYKEKVLAAIRKAQNKEAEDKKTTHN